MVTGDHAGTAANVAQRMGILPDSDTAVFSNSAEKWKMADGSDIDLIKAQTKTAQNGTAQIGVIEMGILLAQNGWGLVVDCSAKSSSSS